MKRKPRQVHIYTYTLLDELTAHHKDPMPAEFQRHQLTRMYNGLHALERGEEPTRDDWRVVSDAVNLMETLIEMGDLQDAGGLLHDAVTAMAMAGKRSLKGGQIRLDGPGINAVRGLLADYAVALEQLPARRMIRAHRLTERRIHEIMQNRRRPHDVEIVDA